MSAPVSILNWLPSLPLFGTTPPTATLFSEGTGTALYRLDWGGQRAVLKYFSPIEKPRNGRDTRRRAEATALQTYAPQGLAPELLWEGDLPAQTGGEAIVYRWLEGQNASNTNISREQIELFAGALRRVHSGPADLRLLSTQPRTLDAWWLRTHELYRDMQVRFADEMPLLVSDALSRLLQPVAADAQAHKRFWQGAPLKPVHGRPEPANLIFTNKGAAFKNWQDFGLGDPSYEVAAASRMLAEQAGEEAAGQLIESYLAAQDDAMLARRIEIYRRIWPFGRLLTLLSTLLDAPDERHIAQPHSAPITFHLNHILATYEWPQETIQSIMYALDPWLSKRTQPTPPIAGTNNGRATTQS